MIATLLLLLLGPFVLIVGVALYLCGHVDTFALSLSPLRIEYEGELAPDWEWILHGK